MQLQNSSSKPSEVMTPMNNEAIAVETIQNWLVKQLASQLSLNAKNIDVREPLTRYGLDSIDAVTLVGDLEEWLSLELPSTLLWDYPTIEKAAQYLVKEFDVSSAIAAAEVAKAEEPQAEVAEKAPTSKGWGNLWGRIGAN